MKYTAEDLYEMSIAEHRIAGYAEEDICEGVGEWAHQSAEQEYASKEEVLAEIRALIAEDIANRDDGEDA